MRGAGRGKGETPSSGRPDRNPNHTKQLLVSRALKHDDGNKGGEAWTGARSRIAEFDSEQEPGRVGQVVSEAGSRKRLGLENDTSEPKLGFDSG